jgi:hypothetical protein
MIVEGAICLHLGAVPAQDERVAGADPSRPDVRLGARGDPAKLTTRGYGHKVL